MIASIGSVPSHGKTSPSSRRITRSAYPFETGPRQFSNHALATVSTYVWLFREYNTLRTVRSGDKAGGGKLRRPTKAEILSVATSFPDVAVNLRLTKPSAPGGRISNAFCRWAIARKCGDAAAAVFFENLANGASLKPNSPILFVREKLFGNMKGTSPQERAELIFKAWNMIQRGEAITHFQRNGREIVNGIRVGSACLPEIEV